MHQVQAELIRVRELEAKHVRIAAEPGLAIQFDRNFVADKPLEFSRVR
jgi:hypothetical protein